MKLGSVLKRFLSAVMVLVALTAMTLPAQAIGQSGTLAKYGDIYYVACSSRLNVRSGPGLQYPVVAKASRGSKVAYGSTTAGWWRVKLPNGTIGWVDKQFLSRSPIKTTGKYVVTAKSLVVRNFPRTTARAIGKLKKGATVNLVHLNGDWGKISVNGREGWVALKYLKKK